MVWYWFECDNGVKRKRIIRVFIFKLNTYFIIIFYFLFIYL